MHKSGASNDVMSWHKTTILPDKSLWKYADIYSRKTIVSHGWHGQGVYAVRGFINVDIRRKT